MKRFKFLRRALLATLTYTCLWVAANADDAFQAEDGIREVERSRGLGDVYKRQYHECGPNMQIQ